MLSLPQCQTEPPTPPSLHPLGTRELPEVGTPGGSPIIEWHGYESKRDHGFPLVNDNKETPHSSPYACCRPQTTSSVKQLPGTPNTQKNQQRIRSAAMGAWDFTMDARNSRCCGRSKHQQHRLHTVGHALGLQSGMNPRRHTNSMYSAVHTSTQLGTLHPTAVHYRQRDTQLAQWSIRQGRQQHSTNHCTWSSQE